MCAKLSHEEINVIYNEGVDCFNGSNYVKAESLLKEVIRNNPNLADVHNKLGVIANLGDNLQEALDHFRTACDLNPMYTEASLNLAITLNELGQESEAIEVFNKVGKTVEDKKTGLDPYAAGKIANEHFKLGNLYQEFGMSEEAVHEYRKALKLRPMVDALTKLGMALRDSGQLESAAVELESAYKENPDYPSAAVQLALTYHLLGKKDEALVLWQEVADKHPDLKEPRGYLKMFGEKG